MPTMEGMEFIQEVLGDIENVEEFGALGGNTCDVCGSKEFFSEQGFYFCTVCSTQSQQAREYIEAEDFQPGLGRGNVRSAGVLRGEKGPRRREQRGQGGLILSNWEVFNCTLKAMADRLIEIGFPMTFKHKVFELWVFYLMKRKVAFSIESEEDITNRMTTAEPTLNKYALLEMGRPKRPAAKKKVTERDTVDTAFISTSQVKKKGSTAKRKALEQNYVEQASQLSAIDTAFETTKKIPKNVPAPIPQIKLPIFLSTPCIEDIDSIDADKLQELLKDKNVLEFLEPEVFSLKSLLALIFIALREVGCSVLYTDVLRMVSDGTLYVSSIKLLVDKIFPEKIDLGDDLFLQVRGLVFGKMNDDQIPVNPLVKYLELPDFKYPTINEFLPKFMDDFALPRELECLIHQIETMLPAEEQVSEIVRRQYRILLEMYVLASITTVLKMLFGLDDVTEKYQSKFARTVNALIAEEADIQGISLNENSETEWIQLFVIEDWFEYIRYRDEVVKSELFCPTMFSPLTKPNFNCLTDLVDRFTGHKGDRPERESTEVKRKTTRDMFRKFSDQNAELEMQSVPNYVTTNLPKESVIHQFVQNSPKVKYPNFKTKKLKHNFKKQRIDFIYNPEKYVYMLEKAGYHVNVVKHDARTYTFPIKNHGDNTVLLFQPYKSYDDFVSSSDKCSASLNSILNACTTIISGSQIHPESRTVLENIANQIGETYCNRCIGGIIPVYPYSESDSELDSESTHSNEMD